LLLVGQLTGARDDDGKRLKELGEFLRAKRRALSPEACGVSMTRRRLSPGLSRYEAANFANIGSSWYARLEAGRVLHPTVATMRAVARALQLTAGEARHIFELAGLPPTELGDDADLRSGEG
jgi:transcriptional regulator with XRE-family HTH domain